MCLSYLALEIEKKKKYTINWCQFDIKHSSFIFSIVETNMQ